MPARTSGYAHVKRKVNGTIAKGEVVFASTYSHVIVVDNDADCHDGRDQRIMRYCESALKIWFLKRLVILLRNYSTNLFATFHLARFTWTSLCRWTGVWRSNVDKKRTKTNRSFRALDVFTRSDVRDVTLDRMFHPTSIFQPRDHLKMICSPPEHHTSQSNVWNFISIMSDLRVFL